MSKSLNVKQNGYRFSDDLIMPTVVIDEKFTFTSNGVSFTSIRVTTDTLYFTDSNGNEVEVYNTSSKWATDNTEFQFIGIESEEVLTSEVLIDWLQSNLNLYITITKNGVATLETHNTISRWNLNIVVNVGGVMN